jgi:NitT/TauT family transport system permease protein
VTAATARPAPAAPAPSRSSGGSRGGRSLGHRLRDAVPTILVFVGVVVVWEVFLRTVDRRGVPVPSPSEIWTALLASWSSGPWPIAPAALNTVIEAVGGLVLGTVAGLIAAGIAERFMTARDILLPLGIGASAVPIIAFAPLVNTWFGVLNPLSKMVIVAVLVFFPVVVNVTRGLTAVDPSALELMRSYAASEWAVIGKLRVPNALPYFFTALKVAMTLSLIGAIVGEYFGGSSDVLGRVIVQSASALRFDVTWAAIVVGAVTGIVLYLVIVAVERVVIPWHASVRREEP